MEYNLTDLWRWSEIPTEGRAIRPAIEELKTAFLSTNPLVWTLASVRFVRRLRRRVFRGATPKWAEDMYDLLEIINLIALLPTLVAVAFAPRHFFDRCAPNAKRQEALYKTPIKFLSKGIALMALAVWLADRHFMSGHAERVLSGIVEGRPEDHLPFKVVLLILVASAPAWIIALSFVSAGIFAVAGLVSGTEWLLFWANLNLILMVLSSLAPRTYRQVWKKQFLFNLAYFGPYLLLVTLVLSAVAAQIFPAFLRMLHFVANTVVDNPLLPWLPRHYKPILGPVFLVVSLLGLFALATQFLLLRPYAYLLRASLRVPTRHIVDWSAEELLESVRALIEGPVDLLLVDQVMSRWWAIKRDINTRERAASAGVDPHWDEFAGLLESCKTVESELGDTIVGLDPLSSNRRRLERFRAELGAVISPQP